jgi:predicted nucleic acid-binding protein
MTGNSLLLDTNTALYLLAGDQTLAEFLNDKKLYISVISELELLGYSKLTAKDIKNIKAFIEELQVENISEEIKNITIDIRRKTKLKLPDCIIAATAIALEIPLLSADTELKNVLDLDLILYEK